MDETNKVIDNLIIDAYDFSDVITNWFDEEEFRETEKKTYGILRKLKKKALSKQKNNEEEMYDNGIVLDKYEIQERQN